MKYFVIPACLGLVAVAVYFVAVSRPTHAAKYYAVEKETAVRPERFEALKYHEADVRLPASTH